MPIIREYEVELTYTMKVTVEDLEQALEMAQRKVVEGYDDVRITNAVIREGF